MEAAPAWKNYTQNGCKSCETTLETSVVSPGTKSFNWKTILVVQSQTIRVWHWKIDTSPLKTSVFLNLLHSKRVWFLIFSTPNECFLNLLHSKRVCFRSSPLETSVFDLLHSKRVCFRSSPLGTSVFWIHSARNECVLDLLHSKYVSNSIQK